MFKKINFFSGQDRLTKWTLIITGIFAVVIITSWSKGATTIGPAMTALGLHGIWVAIAFKKKVKISKTGLEFEEDDEAPQP